MKRLTLIALLFIAGTVTALAQKNTVVGKWRPSSYIAEGMTVNLENPAETKKLLAEQMKKGTGTEPDSAQIEMIYNMVAGMISKMTLEFTDKGQAYVNVPDMAGTGMPTADTSTYVADYSKGIFTTTSKNEDGTLKKETSKFSFEGELLVVENTDKGEIIKLKRVK